MKVLMLGWELPPHNSGGLGVVCYQLCQALSTKGIDIEFVLPYTAEHKEIDFMKIHAGSPAKIEDLYKFGLAYDSHKYVVKNGRKQISYNLFDQHDIYQTAVSKLVETMEFDIIHAHDWLTFRAAIRAKEKSNRPMILHVHSLERDRSGGGYGNPLVREIEYIAFMMADEIIAVSAHVKQNIINEYGIPANKIKVIHNSIEPANIEPLDETNVYKYLSKLKEQGYRVVVNIGRLTVQKGLPNLIQAAKLVIDKNPKTIFMFVGSGEQDIELLELAAELGIGKNVLFTGFQRGKNWRDAYAIGDLFVMPSISEPFGITPLEAAAYGTPSLISKQSGVAEILKNCLKVDYWDIQEMANQIISVMQNDQFRDTIISNASDELKRLSWNKSADDFIETYARHMEMAGAV